MILAILVSLLAVAGFALVLWKSGIVGVAKGALSGAMSGVSAMMDSELDDDAKERAVRSAGFGLIKSAFGVFWRFAAALLAAYLPILAADAIGLVSQDRMLSLMLRLDYIVIVSVVAIVLSEAIRRLRKPATAEETGTNRYSSTDQFFHTIAFASPAVLKAASWIEDRFSSGAGTETAGGPIFVTSLARGGTTAVLNALADIPGMATHTYRDMPFLTAPTLWNTLSGGEKRGVERHQRAHGDGLEIDLDSPEAFEEVIWKMFWPERYTGDTIPLWTVADRNPKANRFLTRHMSKIVHARQKQSGHRGCARYCSKNNGNIARIPYLLDAFPDCRIVVPVRRPESHAASLLRQHENFLKQQADDDFIRRYMRDIGHFEFGQIHKPMAFPEFVATAHDPMTPDYWLNLWLCTFREILNHRDACIFVSQDALRDAPKATMEALCSEIGIVPGDLRFESYFHSKPDNTPRDQFDPDLLKEAEAVFRALVTAPTAVGSASEKADR